ncbi:hypothetical protein N0V93_008861 [Gnomoniopsis smithogilvyi]|uniref:Uncharacterized protein n=1 Tax=Gnomoniopsis smithogilvyi TaxID=1191159 RepID=A0A9W8YLN8_9PEZI|nr:hypothetical protein N0V93_008861 [Gnomoniopsis smithogilvyi]
MTKNHKRLDEQFPSLRWVLPHAKHHARPWADLSAEDKENLNLTASFPYITQIIIREAKLVGGLEKIVRGGQGEASEAAHEAMSSFPDIPTASLKHPGAIAAFIQHHFGSSYTAMTHLRLAGFVGMHVTDGFPTRDVSRYGIMRKMIGEPFKINNSIITNTPHLFINGGYTVRTITWDGRRIDDFAEFLVSISIQRKSFPIQSSLGKDGMTANDHFSTTKVADCSRDELNAKQNRAKKADIRERERILHCIEANKVERKIKQAREQEARRRRQQ